jgi:hypothetical protein
MKYRTFILPWAAVGGAIVALGALLVERLGGWTDERVLLWPTYQLFHLEVFHGSTPGLVLFVLLVQGLVWTVMLFALGFVARHALSRPSDSRRGGAA